MLGWALPPLLSLALTAAAQGRWIAISESRGWTARDVHKPVERFCVSAGAVPSVAGAAAGLLTLSLLTRSTETGVALAVPLFHAAMGIYDDHVGLSNLEKVILGAVPFLLLPPQPRHILWLSLPTWAFPVWAALLGTFSVNAINILAGFNGIEAGYSSLVALALAIHAWLSGDLLTVAVSLVFLAALVPFLRYNVYPARAFPGNVGTFFMGGYLATSALLAGLDWVLILMLFPHAVDFLLKVSRWGRTATKGRSRVLPDGKLAPPPHLSLVGLLLRARRMTEPQLVLSILTLGAAMLALSLFLPPLVHAPA